METEDGWRHPPDADMQIDIPVRDSTKKFKSTTEQNCRWEETAEWSYRGHRDNYNPQNNLPANDGFLDIVAKNK